MMVYYLFDDCCSDERTTNNHSEATTIISIHQPILIMIAHQAALETSCNFNVTSCMAKKTHPAMSYGISTHQLVSQPRSKVWPGQCMVAPSCSWAIAGYWWSANDNSYQMSCDTFDCLCDLFTAVESRNLEAQFQSLASGSKQTQHGPLLWLFDDALQAARSLPRRQAKIMCICPSILDSLSVDQPRSQWQCNSIGIAAWNCIHPLRSDNTNIRSHEWFHIVWNWTGAKFAETAEW